MNSGQLSSEAAHYQAYRYREGRSLAPEAQPENAGLTSAGEQESASTPISSQDGIPYPPPDLIFLVTNGRDAAVFDATGAEDLRLVRQAVREGGVVLPEDKLRVLDWGCGCGRLARHWAAEGASVDLHGCDINPELLGWCQSNLTFGKFSQCEIRPPLPYADSSFDLLYGISVFTHLTFEEHYLWMREIWRVLTPGGAAVVTAHGPTMLPNILPHLNASPADDAGIIRTTLIDEDAFVCIERASGSNFSANALTGDMFARICQPFEVKLHKPRYGLMGIHDTYALEKHSAGPLSFIDVVSEFVLTGTADETTATMSVAGQTSFSVLVSARELFCPATLRLSLCVPGDAEALGTSEPVVIPQRVSHTHLDAAHALVRIDNMREHFGPAELRAEVRGHRPSAGARITLSKAMLF